MRRRSLAAAMIAALVLTLTGCLRYNSIYYIQSDGTVSGQIYTALKDGYQDDSKPYHGTNAGDIAAYFQNATITDFSGSGWYGDIVTFNNEPLSTFAAPPDEAWKVQITKNNNTYHVVGYDTDQVDDNTRNNIENNDGYVYLNVSFPGTLTDAGNAAQNGNTNGIGWAKWDMVNMTGSPYATGNGGLILINPGIFHLNPINPSATPAPSPTQAAPAPQPVTTVVVTPSPTSSAKPSASPSASPSTSAVAAGGGAGGSTGVPPWVWITMAALVVALAGVGGYMVATRGRAPVPATAGDAPDPGPDSGDVASDDADPGEGEEDSSA